MPEVKPEVKLQTKLKPTPMPMPKLILWSPSDEGMTNTKAQLRSWSFRLRWGLTLTLRRTRTRILSWSQSLTLRWTQTLRRIRIRILTLSWCQSLSLSLSWCWCWCLCLTLRWTRTRILRQQAPNNENWVYGKTFIHWGGVRWEGNTIQCNVVKYSRVDDQELIVPLQLNYAIPCYLNLFWAFWALLHGKNPTMKVKPKHTPKPNHIYIYTYT